MEFNKFIQELMDRYSKHGVSEISISIMEGICVIRLVGENIVREDVVYVGVERPEDLANMPCIYAETRIYLPINEEEVLMHFDESFERASKAPPAVVGVELKATTTRAANCRECSARLEDDNVYGLCADCYTNSIN